MIIKLQGLDFYSHHGYYEQEREIGNKYTVDIEVEIPNPSSIKDDELDSTVNYEILYSIVAHLMDAPTKLLETLAFRINQKIIERFDKITSIQSTVSKHNPPIKGVCSRASVTLRTFSSGN